jgi:glycosyltransferase involved in cell wall biosynthesis
VKLSIAMCTYNGSAYLSEQLQSFAAQTRPPHELVISDDQSNDGRTREIIKAFARDSPFTVRLSVNNQTLGSKQNFVIAIGRCTGDIIFLCDQDDVWRSDKLARIEETFKSNPGPGLVFSDAEVVDEDLQKVALLGGRFWQ